MTPRLLRLSAECRQLLDWSAQCYLRGWHWAGFVLWTCAQDVLQEIARLQDIEAN